MANNPKQCPIGNKNQISPGPYTAPGYSQMMLGVRTIKTWNQLTKQFETISRQGITFGTNGGKVFRFGQSVLI